MLGGSFGSEEEETPSPPNFCLRRSQAPPPLHMRQLLISCAELLSRADLAAAHRLISILSSNSSPYGDSTERLVHQFTKALTLRLNLFAAGEGGVSGVIVGEEESVVVHSSYLSLNQVTPFIRFSHLTANQAILEVIEGQHAIHVIDFDIMHGVQWPPLMQALAERRPAPPAMRITATGADLDLLRRTGDRLAKFAHSLGLRFQFHPLVLLAGEDSISAADAALILPDETLAVNCGDYLHRLLTDRDRLHFFLRRVRAMGPAVVAVAEREANHNHPIFRQRFVEAVNHYAAVFDSLEATLPPNSRERLAVERTWFGREIGDIVATEGENRRERHERFCSWDLMMRSAGFVNLPLSPFAVSQAKLLLRLHYPSEGYQLHVMNDCLLLGWQNQPLFSVSAWQLRNPKPIIGSVIRN